MGFKYDKQFEVEVQDSCITYIHLYLDDGYIVKCDFTGGCQSAMRFLSEALLGERLEDVQPLFDSVCNQTNRPCVDDLRFTLHNWFDRFQKDIEKSP